MRIMVVDDHVLFREGLVNMLKSQPDLVIVGEAGSVSEAIARARELKPDLILMDFGLPDGTGPEATRAILAELPHTNIVFLTVHDTDNYFLSGVRSGAKGYLLKDMPFTKLIASIRALEHNEAAISRKMTLRLMDEFAHPRLQEDEGASGLADLSSRERDILRELATGATNQEIAVHFSLSVATVKNHIHRILYKLNLKNRQEAARFARLQSLESMTRS
jgi:two-component system response regulator NreC